MLNATLYGYERTPFEACYDQILKVALRLLELYACDIALASSVAQGLIFDKPLTYQFVVDSEIVGFANFFHHILRFKRNESKSFKKKRRKVKSIEKKEKKTRTELSGSVAIDNIKSNFNDPG